MIRVFEGIIEHLPPVDVGDIVVHRQFHTAFEKGTEFVAECAALCARRVRDDEPSGFQRERDGYERVLRPPRVEGDCAGPRKILRIGFEFRSDAPQKFRDSAGRVVHFGEKRILEAALHIERLAVRRPQREKAERQTRQKYGHHENERQGDAERAAPLENAPVFSVPCRHRTLTALSGKTGAEAMRAFHAPHRFPLSGYCWSPLTSSLIVNGACWFFCM